MRAEAGTWPFRPIHITNDGETIKDPDRSDLDKLTGMGIITNEHLRGIETTMCANLNRPTTLIEFSPSGEAVRTDSPLLDTTPPPCGLLPTCKLLRGIKINGEKCKCCHDCDIVHASLFKGLKINELKNEVQRRIEGSVYIKEYRKRSPEIKIGLHEIEIISRDTKTEKRYCLEYDCPLLGYREVVFPVFFEGKVIAVFFTGQICLASKELDMIKIQDIFFKSDLASEEVKEKKEDIQKKHNDSVKGNFLNDIQYEKLLKEICGEIARLENTLKQEMSLQRERFVREKIDKQIKELKSGLDQSENKEDLKTLWENVGQRMEVLIKNFYIKYVIIFGLERPMQRERLLLRTVASKGNIPQEFSDKIAAGFLKYNLAKIHAKSQGRPITSEGDPETGDRDDEVMRSVVEALEGFPGEFVRKTSLIRVFPLPFSEQGAVVTLIGYHKDNPLPSVENEPGSHLDRHINIFYQSVLLTLSSILAKAAQENISESLRVLGHETNQLNFGLEGIRKRHLSSVVRLRNLDGKKLDDIRRDIEGYFGHLNFLFKQATQAVSELPKPEKKEFWAYREILFKWADMYRMSVRLKNLRFDIFRTWREDPRRPPVYGDKVLLEQLVYSLVSNAVKYCHKGTKIHLDCVKGEPGKKESPHILTVINYGREFKCERPFELSTRGTNVEGVEGLGIGLYNAKRIADAHGGSLELEPLLDNGKISDYNVPLIEPYIEGKFNGKDDSLVELLKKERENLKKSRKYYKIVADSVPYAATKTELVKFIKEATWEVKFRVTIPAKRS